MGSEEWWIGGGDFGRLEIVVVGFMRFVVFLVVEHGWRWFKEVVFIGVIAGLGYEVKMVLAYRFVWKKEVKEVKEDEVEGEGEMWVIV